MFSGRHSRTPERESKAIAKPTPDSIHFLEFQTKMIDLFENVAEDKISIETAFQKLILADNLFDKINKHTYQLRMHWPHGNGTKEILVTLSLNAKYVGAEVYALYFDERTRFLSIYFKDNKMIVEKNRDAKASDIKIWNHTEIHKLASFFNDLFQVDNIHYKYKKEIHEPIALVTKPDACFSKAEFNLLIAQYQFHDITFKINNIILKNSIKIEDAFTFYLNWPDAQGMTHSLKACFSRTDHFYSPYRSRSGYSWFLTEDALLNHFPEYGHYKIKPDQYYYSLTVYETHSNENDIAVLKQWLTLDALFGELHTVKKGLSLSGNEVLNIYKYFDHLFQVKNTFICDAAELISGNDESDEESIDIPLRLILAIAFGKTWYEEKLSGVRLFECKNFKTAHNGIINQSQTTRLKALTELQTLPLKIWYGQLDASGKQTLQSLYEHYFRQESTLRKSSRVSSTDLTLQNLTQKIYVAAKKSKIITPDLINLTKLLCENIDTEENDLDVSEDIVSEKWIQSRIYELIFGSTFWIKQRTQESKEEKSERTLRIRK